MPSRELGTRARAKVAVTPTMTRERVDEAPLARMTTTTSTAPPTRLRSSGSHWFETGRAVAAARTAV